MLAKSNSQWGTHEIKGTMRIYDLQCSTREVDMGVGNGVGELGDVEAKLPIREMDCAERERNKRRKDEKTKKGGRQDGV